MCPRVEDEIASQNASSEIPTAIATKDARNRQIQSQINSCRIDKEEEMEWWRKEWKVETEKISELQNLRKKESYRQNENENGRGNEERAKEGGWEAYDG